MTFHNPAQLDPSLVGPNHKLLTVEELDKPLPEGAEYWDQSYKEWMPCVPGDYSPFISETYRIPLKPSDRLRKEIVEKQELLKVVEAAERGETVQMLHERDGWIDADIEDLEKWNGSKIPVRLKPTPQTIPWTLETRPLTEVWIRSKTDRDEYMITGWNDYGARFSNIGWTSYEELLGYWLQRNGDAAGQEVEG